MNLVDLPLIAARLEGLEETIIHRLIDRAQFAANAPAYNAGESGFPDAGAMSLFDLRLRYQEEMDSPFGRYHVPEERPFHRDLPQAQRHVQLPPSPLHIADLESINLTREIALAYLGFLPELCDVENRDIEDDGHYGSSVEHDVLAIQALARRIHFGALYVAESKYRSAPDTFRRMIDEEDRAGILKGITRPEIEERILKRVAEKVDYIQATANREVRKVVRPRAVLSLYRSVVIPLTKEGEVRYLYQRPAAL
ncbi:MAG: chorismate mutase [Spirochaetales bacterium]